MRKLLSSPLAVSLFALSLVACAGVAEAEDPACLDPETYYAGIDPTDDVTEFVSDISTTISFGTRYIAYDGNWAVLKAVDADGEDKVRLLYTQDTADNDHSVNNYQGRRPPADAWNREHVWPQSRGVARNAAARGDLHHIRAAYVSVNGTRGNKNFGIVEHDEGTEVMGPAVGGRDGVLAGYSDRVAFEPVGKVRGQVARMAFYMTLRYPDLTLTQFPDDDNGTTEMGDLCEMLVWNRDNAVDAFEKERNNRVCTVQYNRNPFIDNPGWADTIWGDDCN